MKRMSLGRKTVAAVALLVAVGAAGLAAPRASANNALGSVACHKGSAWANDPPRVIGWPLLMQRTPGYDTRYSFGGVGGGSYNTGGWVLVEYTTQWLYLRVWANGVPGAWMAGTGEIGAGANPLNSWIEVQPGDWRQAAMFHWDGSGPEDYSFLRLRSSGGSYDVWLEFVWGPIYVKGTSQLAYAGERKWLYRGRMWC